MKQLLLSTLLCGLMMAPFAFTEPNDPKRGTMQYVGSAVTERPAEFGEVFVTFSVDFQDSDADVFRALKQATAAAWTTIKKYAPSVHSTAETDRSFWNEIVTKAPRDGDAIELQTKTKNKGIRTPAPQPPSETPTQLVRMDNRTRLPLDSVEGIQPQIFSGNQQLGIRLSNLNELEAIARAISELPSGKAADEVQIRVGKIDYRVTEATKRAMSAELIEKAKQIAIGKGSKFEVDQKNFPLATAHITNRMPGNDTSYVDMTETMAPVAPGAPHQVKLELSYRYGIYAEGKDLMGSNSTLPLNASYDITESEIANADYLTTTITVTSQWAGSDKKIPAQTMTAHDAILAKLNALVASRNEFNILTDDEPADPQEIYPYEEVERDENKKGIKYRNQISGELHTPTAPGEKNTLPPYRKVTKQYHVTTNQFSKFAALVEQLRTTYGVSGAGKNPKITVTFGEIEAKLTEDSATALALKVRDKAAAGVMSATGVLAGDVFGQGLTNVHLTSFGEQSAYSSRKVMAFASAQSLESLGGGRGGEDGLSLHVIEKPGDQRKYVRADREVIAFNVAFQTEPLESCPGGLEKAGKDIPKI